jgi:hypothetical protein
MRQFHSDRSTVSGPPLLGQQAPGVATASQPGPRVVTSTAPSGSGCSGSASIAREVSAVAAVAEKATEMRTAEEATVAAGPTTKAAAEVRCSTVL